MEFKLLPLLLGFVLLVGVAGSFLFDMVRLNKTGQEWPFIRLVLRAPIAQQIAMWFVFAAIQAALMAWAVWEGATTPQQRWAFPAVSFAIWFFMAIGLLRQASRRKRNANLPKE